MREPGPESMQSDYFVILCRRKKMRPAQPYSPFLPQTAQISAEILRADTRDTRRFPCGDADGPMRPAPFRRTHHSPWPQSATPVRRNLDQHPRFAGTHTFSAKEKDTETGLSYFGSRYYSSDLSIWLSVDPMAAKYASLSPYVYCADNPVKLVDPDGEEISEHIDKYGNIIAHFNDGDNSVYLHKDGTTKADIEAQQNRLNNTGGNGTKVGELGGNIDQSSFFGNKLENSAQYARKIKEMGIVDRYMSYFEKVKPTGDWDLKSNTKTIWGVAWKHDKGKYTTFSCEYFSGATAADVGNFHAGYTGAIAGFSKYILWEGAGGAETCKAFKEGHIVEGLWRLNGFVSPLNLKSGDRWRDFLFNTKGMNAAKR